MGRFECQKDGYMFYYGRHYELLAFANEHIFLKVKQTHVLLTWRVAGYHRSWEQQKISAYICSFDSMILML